MVILAGAGKVHPNIELHMEGGGAHGNTNPACLFPGTCMNSATHLLRAAAGSCVLPGSSCMLEVRPGKPTVCDLFVFHICTPSVLQHQGITRHPSPPRAELAIIEHHSRCKYGARIAPHTLHRAAHPTRIQTSESSPPENPAATASQLLPCCPCLQGHLNSSQLGTSHWALAERAAADAHGDRNGACMVLGGRGGR